LTLKECLTDATPLCDAWGWIVDAALRQQSSYFRAGEAAARLSEHLGYAFDNMIRPRLVALSHCRSFSS
jgi:hypothetical protein